MTRQTTIPTGYVVLGADGTRVEGTVDWPEESDYLQIKALVEPLLGAGEPLEHVTVLYQGQRRDMFVSELGHVPLTTRDPLPINAEATRIYRTNWITLHPDCEPDTLPTIAGTAVLFTGRQVWF